MKNMPLFDHVKYYSTAIVSRVFTVISTIGVVLVVYKWTTRDVSDPQAWKALTLLYLAGLIPCLYLETVLYRYRKRWREQQQNS